MDKGREIRLYRSGSLTTATRELIRCKLDVVSVQEVRWDKGDMLRVGDYVFFTIEKEMKFINWE